MSLPYVVCTVIHCWSSGFLSPPVTSTNNAAVNTYKFSSGHVFSSVLGVRLSTPSGTAGPYGGGSVEPLKPD